MGQDAGQWLAIPCVLAGLGVIALIVLAVVLGHRAEQRRRDGLRQWAARYGWTFALAPATDWPARLPGRNRRGVSLALSGMVDGCAVSIGEYSYTETRSSTDASGNSTSSSHTYQFVVVVVRLRGRYPAVVVHERGLMSKMGRALFGDGEAATGDERFDRRFRVATADPGTSRRLVGPALAAAHVAGAVPLWSLHGDELLTYQRGRIGDPGQIPATVAPLTRVVALFGR